MQIRFFFLKAWQAVFLKCPRFPTCKNIRAHARQLEGVSPFGSNIPQLINCVALLCSTSRDGLCHHHSPIVVLDCHPLTQSIMKLAVIAVAISALSPSADAFAPSSAFNGARMAGATTTRSSTSTVEMSAASDNFKKAATGALAIFAGLSLFTATPSDAISRDTLDSLSYTQVKGTGLANRCPDVSGEDTISVNGGAKIVDMCIEPKNFQVLSKVREREGERVCWPAALASFAYSRCSLTFYSMPSICAMCMLFFHVFLVRTMFVLKIIQGVANRPPSFTVGRGRLHLPVSSLLVFSTPIAGLVHWTPLVRKRKSTGVEHD